MLSMLFDLVVAIVYLQNAQIVQSIKYNLKIKLLFVNKPSDKIQYIVLL